MSEANNSPSSSHALVALTSDARGAHVRPAPRLASFLAHLIATARQAPQTRELRRADTAEVIAAYKAAIAKLQTMNT